MTPAGWFVCACVRMCAHVHKQHNPHETSSTIKNDQRNYCTVLQRATLRLWLSAHTTLHTAHTKHTLTRIPITPPPERSRVVFEIRRMCAEPNFSRGALSSRGNGARAYSANYRQHSVNYRQCCHTLQLFTDPHL